MRRLLFFPILILGIALLLLTATLIHARRQAPEQWMYFIADGLMYRLSSEGGTTQYIGEATLNPFNTFKFSDDGFYAYYTVLDAHSPDYISRLNLISGHVQNYKHTSEDWTFLNTSPDQQWIYAIDYNSGILFRIHATSGIRQDYGRLNYGIVAWSQRENWAILRDFNLGELFRLDFDTNTLFNLTNNPSNEYFVTLSPDEEWLYFESGRDPALGIYIYRMHLDGTHIEPVIDEPYDAFSSWSPDGEWMLFRSLRTDGLDLFRARPDGSDFQNLTNTLSLEEYYEKWSPDGNWMYFVHNRTPNSGTDLYRMRPDGSERQRLTDHENVASFGWVSPNQDWVLYLRGIYSDDLTWWKIRVDGTEDQPLAEGIDYVRFGGWTSDGTAMILTLGTEVNQALYQVSIDDSDDRKQLTKNYQSVEFFAFSPTIDLPFNPISLFIVSLALIGGSQCAAYYFSRS